MKRPLAVVLACVVGLLAALVPVASASADAATYGFTASAKWVNGTVTVVYSWNGLPAGLTRGALHLELGQADFTQVTAAGTDRVATIAATTKRWGRTVRVAARVSSCVSAGEGQGETCTDDVLWSQRIPHHEYVRQPGQGSTVALLGTLTVTPETRAGGYSATRFGARIDADRDGETTRAEVLEAESTKPVRKAGGSLAGRWVSPWDDAVLTSSAKVAVDHLVPLEEAWTSGAAAWTARKRAAFANDLGFAPSLVAVSLAAKRAKAADPDGYLPASRSAACTYLRNTVAVKARWGLTVDAAEKAFLRAGLARYCLSPYVRKAPKPDVASLLAPAVVATPRPAVVTPTRDPQYRTCTELLRHANHAPYQRGVDPEYAWYEDRDHDGWVCE